MNAQCIMMFLPFNYLEFETYVRYHIDIKRKNRIKETINANNKREWLKVLVGDRVEGEIQKTV